MLIGISEPKGEPLLTIAYLPSGSNLTPTE
jgi:hypothetical protein